MLLKESRQSFGLNVIKKIFSRKLFLVISTLALISLPLAFMTGALAHKKGILSAVEAKAYLGYLTLKHPVRVVKRTVSGYFADPERITIDIKFKHFDKITKIRENAIAKDFLVTSADDYVPAKIRYKNKTYNVKLRLKGDGSDHWSGDKWSFRIKVLGEETLFGAKRFSIQQPEVRHNIHEWVFLEAAKQEGLVALNYDFIDVVVNGEHKGIYALEEYPMKYVLERNARREGVILKFNDDLHFEEMRYNPYEYCPLEETSRQFQATTIDTFMVDKVLADMELKTQFETSAPYLEAFRSNKAKTSDIFDIDKMARYMAIADLLGGTHGIGSMNQRFYYNTSTGLLEPIPYDNMPGKDILFLVANYPPLRWSNCAYNADNSTFLNLLFSDMEFFEKYINHLERVSQKEYLDEFFDNIGDNLEDKLGILYRDYPNIEFNREVFYRNQSYIRRFIAPIKGLLAYSKASSSKEVTVSIGNIQTLPVEVLAITIGNMETTPETKTVIKPWKHGQPSKYQDITFAVPAGAMDSPGNAPPAMQIKYKVIGTTKIMVENVNPWPISKAEKSLESPLKKKGNLASFDFVSVNEASREALVLKGTWTLDRDLIVPEGHVLAIPPGTKIKLSKEANIISRAPLRFEGTREEPIIIESKGNTGQGIHVVRAGAMSSLKHVIFKGLTNPHKGGWELSGAVTFYESPVTIESCVFTGSRSEDALNIIRSNYVIKGTLFEKSAFDAFDADFSNGVIVGTRFYNNGNDSIDISGSVAKLENIIVKSTGDKGISAGEASRIEARGLKIEGAYIGIASKDLSEVVIDSVEMVKAKVGFAAYEKKPEFGPGRLTASGYVPGKTETAYLTEKNSEIILNGIKKPANSKSVMGALYGQEQ